MVNDKNSPAEIYNTLSDTEPSMYLYMLCLKITQIKLVDDYMLQVYGVGAE